MKGFLAYNMKIVIYCGVGKVNLGGGNKNLAGVSTEGKIFPDERR